MSIFSRRKRLLNRTRPPKMSSRRQFHKALRRHPAWPMVMAEAAARAQRAQEAARRDRAGAMEMGPVSHRKRLRGILNRNRTNVVGDKERRTHSGVAAIGRIPNRAQFRRALRQKRVFVVTLIAVGALVALLNGIGAATHGNWFGSPNGQGGSSSIPPRFGAATVFDKNREEILVFGGFSGIQPPAIPGLVTPNPTTDDKTWGSHSTNRNPSHHPSARGFASIAYDDARKNAVLFGGAPYRSNAVSGETWTWDGVDWTLRNPPGPRPPARQNAVMAYDAHRRNVVMFGGRDADNKALGDTWTWNGSAWKKVEPPANSPPPAPRHSAAMEYDLCRGEAVMFGGIGPTPPGESFPPQPGETWTWNGANWTPKTPVLVAEAATPLPGSPPPRIGASMAYSNKTGRILLYGGLTTTDTGHSTVATDESLWMWDGAGWEKEVYTGVDITVLANVFPFGFPVVNNTSPPPRAYASFTFDPVKRYATLFSGTPADQDPTVPQVALPDYWTFSESQFATDLAVPTVRQLALSAGPRHCSNPVPIPPASDQVEVPKPPQFIKTQTREEIQEIGRLPALVGTNPKAVPAGAPKPDCLGRELESPSRTHLATDPRRNRVYQFFHCGANDGDVKRVLIQAYDGTTLKPVSSAIALITVPFRNEIPALADNLLHDSDRGRFFYRDGQSLWEIDQALIERGINPVVRKLTIPSGPTGTLSPVPINGISLFDHPKTGRAKLLISFAGVKVDVGPVVVRPSIAQWDIDGNRQDFDWRREVEACNRPLLTSPMRVGNRVYSSCTIASASGGLGASSAAPQSAVVRMPVAEVPNDPVATDGEDSPATLPVELFPGPFGVGERTWADPKTERYLLLSEPFNGQGVWQFDGKASAYVGRSGLSKTSFALASFGFDQEAGRLYAFGPDHKGSFHDAPLGQGGLFVVDTHLTPITQAINFAQFMYPGGPAIGVLPSQPGVPRRIFVRRIGGSYQRFIDGQIVAVPQEDHYKVLADLLPVSEPPEIGQLDALTLPVAESLGKTEASFNAEGSGYGVRLRSVGGVLSALRSPPQIGGGVGLLDEVRIRHLVPACFFPDRELVAGWVSQARMSDLEASARSLGLDVDSNSKFDLEALTTRCLPTFASSSSLGSVAPPSARPYVNALWGFLPFAQLNEAAGSGSVEAGDNQFNAPTSLAWNRHFHEVECTGDSSNVTQTAGADASSSATCNQKDDPKDDWVKGTARGALGPASAGFSVGEGNSDVVVKRDPVKGVVVTSTAEAKDIKLPTGLTIGYVKTEAVAWSNGRPGEGRATFTRTICNVNPPLPVNPANSDPRAPNTGCLNESQQKQMAADFNARMGINGKMILPTPDPDFFRGSPGGYIAGVTKPKATEVEDQMLARDIQREVPGLEIVFYKDNSEYSGRQILLLAAVRAVSTYGVQCASEFIYSSTAKNCVALTFEDDPVIEEFFEEEDTSSTDDSAFNSFDDGGAWTPIETDTPSALSLGRRLGQFIENLPVIRRLPIRQMGEALMAASVWMLLGLPLLLASRRFALTLARRSE